MNLSKKILEIVDGTYPDNVKLTIVIHNDDDDLTTIYFTVSDTDGSTVKVSAHDAMAESQLNAVDKVIEMALTSTDLREGFEMHDDILPKFIELIESGAVDDLENEFHRMVSEQYE